MAAAQDERRRWPRYRAKNGTLLFNDGIFAEIINISKGGVLCAYLAAHGESNPAVRLINLIDTDTKLCLSAIPCADLNYQDSGLNMPLARLRKSRLKFIPAGEGFRRELHNFIDAIIAEPA
ncbi:MAG: hypothetical protein LBU39_12265 [Desulfobulbaceae bacterium]|jgi:hypothetical protein|nr:hypothetical protein [Desulfobulbaceae bacterium]